MEATYVPLTSAVASKDEDTNRPSYDSDFEREYRQALELLKTQAAKTNAGKLKIFLLNVHIRQVFSSLGA